MAEQKIMLGEWAADWFQIHAVGKLAHNTVDGYRNLIFNHIMPGLGYMALTDLSEQRIRAFYRKLSKEGLGDRSVWCIHLLLRRVLEEACRNGLIPENPARRISVEHSGVPEASHMHSGQIKRYLNAAQELRAYPILYVGLASGLRQGELISLSWAAVDFCGRRVILKKRWVRLSDRAAELMAEEHARHPERPEVFLDAKTGQPYTPPRLYYLHRKVLKQVRLPVVGFRQLQENARGLGL